MNEEIRNKLLEKYDKDHEFKVNERYSRGGNGTVYTKPDDKFHWLVIEEKGKEDVQVTLTDDTGRIVRKDDYKIKDDELSMVEHKQLFKEKLAINKRKADEYNARRKERGVNVKHEISRERE